ncbi:MAG: VOC family protein [Candidatus Hodarchaeales archaeon]|jgi:predicted enzyme related to lactoylglutathione lyase
MVAKVNHVEIPVLDLEKAKAFFSTIFGWQVDLESFEGYGLVDIPDSVSIGLYKVEKIPDHGINVVFEVEDINQKLKEIEAQGGETLREKQEIAPDVGYSAQFKDCFGNELGLFARS